jgi:transposase
LVVIFSLNANKSLHAENRHDTFNIIIRHEYMKGKGAMPQRILPLIPRGATQINGLVSVWRDNERWTYFLATHPIYSHRKNDHRMFRLITSQLIDSGSCRQIDIIRTFGLSKSSVIRAVKKLRDEGPEAFFAKHRSRRGGKVFSADVLDKAQRLLDQGYSRSDAVKELGVKYDTFRKAINDGRLVESSQPQASISKSSRSMVDAAAADEMGVACTRVGERVLASLGKLVGAAVSFETCLDVPKAGVLCALPALVANGLFHGVKQLLGNLTGYYTTFQVLILLALMALCRIKTTEKLRGHAPGEIGKLLGLDRAPEVRCLRNKMDELSAEDGAEHWAAHLGKYWMEQEPESVGALYVDGHVRVYHGHLTQLPRRYVSRQRLCLRGITDYWVNDAIGRPFDQEPCRCRFVLVFDREGYSPAFFHEMWSKHRIGCLTYHKHPSEPWPQQWFSEHEVTMPSGEVITMQLCEMGSHVGSGKDAIWMREVRKLTASGHKTSLII